MKLAKVGPTATYTAIKAIMVGEEYVKNGNEAGEFIRLEYSVHYATSFADSTSKDFNDKQLTVRSEMVWLPRGASVR